MRELAFERAAQVVDFFIVDEQIAVARHAELVAAEHLHARRTAWKRTAARCRSTARQRLAPIFFGQRNHARQRARRLHDGEAGIAAERVLACEAHDEIEALVLDAGKRPRRIEAEGRQDRLDLALEISLEPLRGRRCPRWRARVVRCPGAAAPAAVLRSRQAYCASTRLRVRS